MKPRISVVVPVHDHGYRERLLTSLAAQTVPHEEFEVLLVDTFHHTDWSAPFATALATTARGLRARYVRLPPAGRSTALNHGVHATSGDVVVFLADDFVVEPGWLEAHLRFHRDHPDETAVAVGPNVFPSGRRTGFMAWVEDSGALYGVSFTRPDPARSGFFYFANTSLKRSFLARAGGFDEGFVHHCWEDYELGVRLFERGMRVTPLPEANTVHEHEMTFIDRREQVRLSGASAHHFAQTRPLAPRLRRAVRLGPWPFRLNAAYHRALYALFRREKDLILHWRRTLSRDFVLGYRDAERAARRAPTAAASAARRSEA